MNDRTGQTWEYGAIVYLVVRPPFLSGVGRVGEQLWYHPCVLLENGEDSLYGEHEHHLWEEDGPVESPMGVLLYVERKRIS